jgi:hypothetical protein
MTDLIQRLTNASEGSRELDAMIHWRKEIGDREVVSINPQGQYISVVFNASDRVADGCDRYMYGNDVAPFTTSIDAAMTLVPEGWVITDVSQRLPCNQNWEWAVILGKLVDGEWELANGCSKTAPGSFALAICIAALRAKDAGHE